MIEKEIEKAVLGALHALNLDRVDIGGFWQSAPAGEVKGAEKPDARAVLRVVASPMAFDTFSSSKANISVAIALVIRKEMSPGGEAIEELSAPISAMLEGWHMSIDLVKNDFAVPGFVPCGLRLDGGEPSNSAEAWAVTQKFTLRGVVNKRR